MNKAVKAVMLLTLSLCVLAGTFAQAPLVAKKPFFAGFAQDTLNQPWRNYQAVCVERELKKVAGVKVIITDGTGKAEKQISNVEDMIARGLDILLISPAQEGALTPIVSQVYKSGIPVVLVDRGITSQDYTCFVKGDNVKTGAMAADYIAAQMTAKYGSPKGNLVVIEGVPGSTTSVERDKGLKTRLAQAYPNIKILASQPADYRRDKAMQVMEDFLQTFPKIDAVFTYADESTMGAIFAIENAKRRSEMIIGSVNATTEAIKAIMDGRMDFSVLYSNCAAKGVEMAVRIMNGETVPKVIVVDPVNVTKENAKSYYKEGTYSAD